MRILDLISAIIHRVGEIFIVILTLLMVVVITLQVISRYIFNAPFSWTMEANIFLFAWLIFIGASVVLKEGRHVKMELFLTNFSMRKRKIISIFVSLLLVVFLVILLRNNILLFPLHSQFRTPVVRIPMSWFNLAFTVSCIFMLLHGLQKMIKDVYEMIHSEEKRGGSK